MAYISEEKCKRCGRNITYVDDKKLDCICLKDIKYESKQKVHHYQHYPLGTSVFGLVLYDACPKCGFKYELVEGKIDYVGIEITDKGVNYSYDVDYKKEDGTKETIYCTHDNDCCKIFDTQEEALEYVERYYSKTSCQAILDYFKK